MNKSKSLASFSFLEKIFLMTIILGIIFRFLTFNYFFWSDEIWTLLRVSGYTQTELTQVINERKDKNFIEVSTLKQYQTTNNNKNLTDTFHSLTTEDAHLTPVYFVLTRWWMNWFGDSIITTRTLPFIFSLFILPCVYWLCLELFPSQLTGWIAMALIAISPVHLFFSTYVRFYSLSTLTILISCITLLRAMRINNKMSWILYAVFLTISFYTYLFSGLVAIGHGIYILLREKIKITKKVIAYMGSSLVATICFFPWLIVIIKSLSTVKSNTGWLVQDASIKDRILTWIHNFSIALFDISNTLNNKLLFEKILLIKLPDLISFLLVLYSFYFLFKKASQQSYFFVFTLAGSTAFLIILMDLRSGTIASFDKRYLLPSFLGIQLSVAHLISYQISSFSKKNKKYGYSILIGVVLSSILACSILVLKGPWQGSLSLGRLTPNDLQERSQIINQSKFPVLFGNPSSESLLSISRQVKPDVKILLSSETSPIDALKQALAYSNNVFLYDSSLTLEQNLSNRKDIKIIPIFSSENRIILKKIEKQ
ncbi:MAG: glycosyltransferase family 39 protein [Scytonema sp. PMC 1070.18]|nr:glycosyltransferase family 39 protein [Scytonema sp. PMC 1070.18]